MQSCLFAFDVLKEILSLNETGAILMNVSNTSFLQRQTDKLQKGSALMFHIKTVWCRDCPSSDTVKVNYHRK